MLQILLDDLRAYFVKKGVLTDTEKLLLQRLQTDIYPILDLQRDDLARMGFDNSRITNEQMRSLAKNIASDYCDNESSEGENFWEELDSMADNLGLPRYPECPFCGHNRSIYNSEYGTLTCEKCELQWHKDFYVLVESAEDVTFFEDSDIGYSSVKGHVRGRYVTEYEYIQHFESEPDDTRYCEAVCWPESEPYLEPQEDPEDAARFEPIKDQKGLSAFGEKSVWIQLLKCEN